MSAGAAEGSKDMGAATMLTPKVKLAITADKMLNDSKNLIDVDSTSDKVSLNGHVMSAEQKTLAGEITMRVLKENNATQKFVNNLDVTP
jgi:osmotically-inducible protein OsmY